MRIDAGCAEHFFIDEPAQMVCFACGRAIQKEDVSVRDLWLQWKIGKSYQMDFRDNPGGVLQLNPPMWFLEFELGLFE